MTTALIADDEPLLRGILRDHLQLAWPDLQVVAEAGDGRHALQQIAALNPDVAFLDIDMPGLSGLEVAQALARSGDAARTPRVVFITAHPRHALEAFDADAVDYIVKPLELARLVRLVGKLRRSLPVRPADAGAAGPALNAGADADDTGAGLRWLRVSAGSAVRMVHVDEVLYFESDTKYTRVVCTDHDGLIRTSIKELTQALGADYVPAHRGVLVNRRYISTVVRRGEQMELELKDGRTRLKVSGAHQHLFRAM